MRAFAFQAPDNLPLAIALLAGSKGSARPLAGGTDLIAQIKENRRSPTLVIDVKRIPELNVLAFHPEEGLRIGAAVSCSDIADFEPVRARYPVIAESCRLIGSVQIQNRAGIGGNICNAAPSADTVPGLLVLEATAVVEGPEGQRRVPLREFFTGPGQTVLAPDELLVEVDVPPPPPHSAARYQRFIPRNEMDIAVAGVASFVALNTDGTIRQARIALASVAPTPIRAPEAEQSLAGRRGDPEDLRRAGELAAAAARPISDVRGSADYRRQLVQTLTRRTLAQALAEARSV